MIVNKFVNVRRMKTFRLMAPLFLFLALFLSSFSSSFGQTVEAQNNFAQCKACHTIGGGRLVGPDLKGVPDKYPEAWLIKFIQNSQAMVKAGDKRAVKIFDEYNKIPMPSHNLTDAQVKDILLYIKNGGKLPAGVSAQKATVKTTVAPAPQVNQEDRYFEQKRDATRNLAIAAIIFGILLMLSIMDLIFTQYLKARWIHYIIILLALWILGEWTWDYTTSLGRQQNYQPDQPIAFSHKVHAGQNQINCEYCHFTAETSMHAGIPPASVCMNCHSVVKKGKLTGTKEIAKIYAAIKEKKPIQWVKVDNLPDFVYFNHEQHVKVGKIDCKECHGDVAKMDQVAEVHQLSMGWCLSCHRKHKVQFNHNKFYAQYKKLHEELKAGKIDKVTVSMVGGEDCAKCHY